MCPSAFEEPGFALRARRPRQGESAASNWPSQGDAPAVPRLQTARCRGVRASGATVFQSHHSLSISQACEPVRRMS
jgi:hypothetical protein